MVVLGAICIVGSGDGGAGGGGGGGGGKGGEMMGGVGLGGVRVGWWLGVILSRWRRLWRRRAKTFAISGASFRIWNRDLTLDNSTWSHGT